MKKKSLLIIIVIIAVIALGGFGISTLFKDKDKTNNYDGEKEEVKSKVNIVDLNSNKRPIAVMINTHNEA